MGPQTHTNKAIASDTTGRKADQCKHPCGHAVVFCLSRLQAGIVTGISLISTGLLHITFTGAVQPECLMLCTIPTLDCKVLDDNHAHREHHLDDNHAHQPLTCSSWLHDKSRKRSCFSFDSTGGTRVSRLSLRLRAVRLVSLDRSGRCILMATAAGRGAPESLCSAKPVAFTQDKLHCQPHSATLIESIPKRQGKPNLFLVHNRSCKGVSTGCLLPSPYGGNTNATKSREDQCLLIKPTEG